ncbi:hypothetical protein EX30DRAFT_339296 [Ascodesmis nigricans]|uniref:Uncharacterized protein n=1 Tax=Ascodesmis nigricans TaxID=341454 RepID=A0A4S2N1P4_9PEZI|nr:hypothetical protein EX30DRAFT_339296 [Ascodesmis nigricans]
MSLLHPLLLRRSLSTTPRLLSNAHLKRGEPGFHGQGSTDTAPGHPVTTLYPHGAPADKPPPSTIADAPVTPFGSTLANLNGPGGPEEAALDAMARTNPVPKGTYMTSHIAEDFETHFRHARPGIYNPEPVSIASLLPWAPAIPCGHIGSSAAVYKAMKEYERRKFPRLIAAHKKKNKRKEPSVVWKSVKRQQVRMRLLRKVVRGDIGTQTPRRGVGILAHVYRATFGKYGEKRQMVTAVKAVIRDMKNRKLELAKKQLEEKKKAAPVLKPGKKAGKKK